MKQKKIKFIIKLLKDFFSELAHELKYPSRMNKKLKKKKTRLKCINKRNYFILATIHKLLYY